MFGNISLPENEGINLKKNNAKTFHSVHSFTELKLSLRNQKSKVIPLNYNFTLYK